MGDLAAARPYLERALDITEKALGPDHPDTVRSLNNLGGLLKTMGDLAAARPYYERALAITEKALRPRPSHYRQQPQQSRQLAVRIQKISRSGAIL
jgi:tetratricopeptide (TPR) repeat protein